MPLDQGLEPTIAWFRKLLNRHLHRQTLMPALSRNRDPASQWLVLEPNRIEKQYWKDLWRYRELFAILAWRDITVRYKQTIIGVAWALIRLFFTMVVFTVIFGRLAKLPTEGAANYAILVFAAIPQQFFSTVLSSCSDSVIGNSNLRSSRCISRG